MTVLKSSFLRAAVVVSGVALLAACQSPATVTAPQTSQSRALDSGVTSSNGGGMAPANFGTSPPVRVQQ